MKRRPAVEHAFKDRCMILQEQKAEMQERINNLESALDDETAESGRKAMMLDNVQKHRDKLIECCHDAWDLNIRTSLWLTLSLVVNCALICYVVWKVVSHGA